MKRLAPHGGCCRLLPILFMTAACSEGTRPTTPRYSPPGLVPEIAKTCVRVNSCLAASDISTWLESQQPITECIWNNDYNPSKDAPKVFSNGLVSALYSCLDAASTCSALLSCFTPFLSCYVGPDGGDGCPLVEPGTSCLTGPDERQMCANGLCDPDAGAECMGEIAPACFDGFLINEPCDEVGETCRNGDGGAACVGTGPACTDQSSDSYCADDSPTYCTDGHEWMLGRCSDLILPATCSNGGCSPMAGSGCDPNAFADTCDGNNLVYCSGGIAAVDCQDAGFSTCRSNRGIGYAWCE